MMTTFYLKDTDGHFTLAHTPAEAIVATSAGYTLCSAAEYMAAVYPVRGMLPPEPGIADDDTQRVRAIGRERGE